MRLESIRVLLFDLDGTFIDSSPGMVRSANALRAAKNLAPLDAGALLHGINRGARGMLDLALSITPEHPEYTVWRDRFHDEYARALAGSAQWIPGMRELVDALEAQGIAWGIVTNKASRFAHPICEELGISARASCVVCGDTTPHTKPHPAPLLFAASQCGVSPEVCAYAGDDRRDITAARAACMVAVAARYGFLANDDDPDHWGADLIIDHPLSLAAHFN